MIDEIICHIDETLIDISFIDKCYGRAELVTNDEESSRKYPAIYSSSGQLKRIDFEPGICYHRISAPILTAYPDADDNGLTIPVIITYPLLLVACINRKQTDIEAVQKLMYELTQIDFFPLKSKIKFQVIKARLINSNIDRYLIWNTETDGAGLSIDFDKSLIAITYQIDLHTYTKCLNNCDE